MGFRSLRVVMADHITIEAETQDGPVPYSAVREAMASLSDDDVSKTSPVTPGGSEVGVTGGENVEIHVEGHSGEFTKTTEEALVAAVEAIEGTHNVRVTQGGYTDGDDDVVEVTEDGEDGDGEGADDEDADDEDADDDPLFSG